MPRASSVLACADAEQVPALARLAPQIRVPVAPYLSRILCATIVGDSSPVRPHPAGQSLGNTTVIPSNATVTPGRPVVGLSGTSSARPSVVLNQSPPDG